MTYRKIMSDISIHQTLSGRGTRHPLIPPRETTTIQENDNRSGVSDGGARCIEIEFLTRVLLAVSVFFARGGLDGGAVRLVEFGVDFEGWDEGWEDVAAEGREFVHCFFELFFSFSFWRRREEGEGYGLGGKRRVR